jgi:hypothetical protein
MKSLMDPTFRYFNSANTNLRRTFARVRREQKEDAEREAQATAKVQPINPQQRRKA